MLITEYLRNSQGASIAMLEDSLGGTLKRRPGRTRRGVSTKSQERSIQRVSVAGVGGQNPQIRRDFLAGLTSSRTLFSVDLAAGIIHPRTKH